MRPAPRTSVVLMVLALAAGLLAATASTTSAAAPAQLRGSVNQVYVLGASPGQTLQLVGTGERVVATGTVDASGSLAWRELKAGSYAVRATSGPAVATGTVTVTDVDGPAPPQSLYSKQTLGQGFGYITTRDGTTLSANVVLPSGTGPFPTVVEYSGYDPSNPKNTTMAQLFTTLGFAYVGVNVRGTGCSGGSFRPFEPVQSVDGFDAIETIAAQPWAKFHRVGMVGISYPGIEQLYVAQTRPPSLSAITPLSVIADTFRSTLYPGGILNTGFAVAWATDRVNAAKPAAHQWVKDRISGGDTVCEANQALRLQSVDLLNKIDENPYYLAQGGDELSPRTFVHKITVSTYIGGAFQDEQTGGAWSTMLDDFAPGTKVRAYLTNGVHAESLAGQDLTR